MPPWAPSLRWRARPESTSAYLLSVRRQGIKRFTPQPGSQLPQIPSGKAHQNCGTARVSDRTAAQDGEGNKTTPWLENRRSAWRVKSSLPRRKRCRPQLGVPLPPSLPPSPAFPRFYSWCGKRQEPSLPGGGGGWGEKFSFTCLFLKGLQREYADAKRGRHFAGIVLKAREARPAASGAAGAGLV